MEGWRFLLLACLVGLSSGQDSSIVLSVNGSKYPVHPAIISSVAAGLSAAFQKPISENSPLRYIHPDFLKMFNEATLAGVVPAVTEKRYLTPKMQKGIGDFSLRMLKIFDGYESKRNIVLSPLSLGITLAFLMQFSEGTTKLELENVMGMNTVEAKSAFKTISDNLRLTKNEYKISIINMLLISTPSEEVRNVANELLMTITKLEKVDVGTVKKINAYISNNTYNYITEIIDPESISRFTASFLLNALAFRGFWETEFLPQNTKRATFNYDNERAFTGDFMHSKGQYSYQSNDIARWIELPMKGGVSLMVVLPNERFGLDDMISRMDRVAFLEIMNTVNNKRNAGIKIPKFEVKYKTMLRNAFDQMGLYGLLSEGIYKIRADKKPVTVGESSHGTTLKIDERGASGSGYTVHQIERLASNVVFAIDEPFLAILVEDVTRAPIIMAKIIDPFPAA